MKAVVVLESEGWLEEVGVGGVLGGGGMGRVGRVFGVLGVVGFLCHYGGDLRG